MFENGSEILKLDCHLHTRKDKEFNYGGEDDRFVSDYVAKLEEQNIRLGIITNHNKFDEGEYKAIKKAAIKKDILILPGVELSVKEGAGSVHMLIVFNPTDWLWNGNNYITRVIDSLFLNIANPGEENTHCGKDIMTCLRELNQLNKDYFVIFAHVEQNKGFWEECDGAIISSLSSMPEFRERVLGFQKVRTKDKAQIVHNWMGYDIASVEGSDPKCIADIGKGDNETFVKIGEFSFNAVKYAMRDYHNRIFDKKPDILHGYIKSMRCIGGKLDGQQFNPSMDLNTLIGIRGSGKSSVLEVLRYALDIEPAVPDREYKNGLVKSVLGSGGQVELTIVDKYKREYTIKRIYNERLTITDDTGKVLNVPVNSVMNNPLYFGQKDLALTRSGYEMELLNKIVGNNALDVSGDIKLLLEQLTTEIKKYRTIMDIPEKISDISAQNGEIQHKLKIYREKGVDDKLRKQTACNEDLIKLDSIYNNTKEVLDMLEKTYTQEKLQELSLNDYISLYNAEIFDEAKQQSDFSIATIKVISNQIEILRASIENFWLIREKLAYKIDSLKEEFAIIKREINDDSIDLEKFVSYQKQLVANNEEMKRLLLMLKDKETLQVNIKTLLDERNKMLQKCFQAYEQNIAVINSKQQQLHISIEFKGNRERFKTDLKNFLKGTGLTEAKYDELVEAFSDFAAIIEDYYLDEGKKLRDICSVNTFSKISEKLEDNYAELLQCVCPDLIKITYHGKTLSKHSLGQRASALILFILTQNDSDVIIIDQPEDDLDNQVIYKELIQTIKAEKKHMQFIFATHNANIPVLGDAERVVTITYDGENEKIALDQGTIDSESTHKHIVDIMEGGEEAFKKRNEIYTSW